METTADTKATSGRATGYSSDDYAEAMRVAIRSNDRAAQAEVLWAWRGTPRTIIRPNRTKPSTRMSRRTCVQCASYFNPNDKRQKLCSDECKRKRKEAQDKRRVRRRDKSPLPPKTCPICRELFSPQRADKTYCRPTCQRAAKLAWARAKRALNR